MIGQQLRVFISSTAADLGPHRQVAERVILQHGWQPVMLMEHEAVFGGQTVAACKRLVQSCHLFVQIIGHRYGWVPTPAQGGNGIHSITALELLFWIEKCRRMASAPPLLLFAKESSTITAVSEEAIAFEKFRESVRSRFVVHFFDLPRRSSGDGARQLRDFESKVRTQLSKVKDAIAEHKVKTAQQQIAEAEAKAKNDGFWKLAIGGALGFGLAAIVQEAEPEPPPKPRRRKAAKR